jgi:hypothetical protein
MACPQGRFRCAAGILAALLAFALGTLAESQLPIFGRDTVLVWKIKSRDFDSEFVARIAEFSPDRFLEWEDSSTQGTIFMPSRDVLAAKGYVSANLFESGVDSRGKNVTTLWLSQQIYRDLKSKRKVKCNLDSIASQMTYRGDDHLTVEVNRSPRELPVIRVTDDRGSERWFLDQEENPLMVKHMLREFSQTLTSITTDRPNTLRWIKGKKLANPPH